MERQAASAITAVVRHCLDECRKSENPLAVVAQTVQRLQESDWHEADVRQVQAVVHKFLVAVVSRDEVEHAEIDVPVAEPETSITRPASDAPPADEDQ